MTTWEKIEAKRSYFDQKYERVFRKVLMDQVKLIADNIDSTFIDNYDVLIPAMLDNEGMKEAFVNLYQKVGVAFRDQYLTSLKNRGISYSKKGLEEDLWTETMTSYAEMTLAGRVALMDQTTKEILLKMVRDSIQAGVDNGLSIESIATKIKHDLYDKYPNYAKHRGRTIAQTEVVSASNYSSYRAALDSGVMAKKVWLTAPYGLSKTERHNLVEGLTEQRPAMNEPFIVNGARMQHPGDPNGGAENVINCFTKDQVTNYPPEKINKVYKSRFKGKVTTFNMACGKQFTCTPNHPILTNSGWKFAKNINNGDKLIKASLIEALFSDFHINNTHATFEEVYDSLSVVGVIVRMSGINVNFYGDVPSGDVDIINKEGKLRYASIAMFSKLSNRNIFKFSNFTKSVLFSNSLLNCGILMKRFRHFTHRIISVFSDSLSFLFGTAFKTNDICLAASPAFNVVNSEYPGDCVPTNIKLLTNSKNTDTGIEKGNNGSVIDSIPGAEKFIKKARIGDYLPDEIIIALHNISDLLHGKTIGIHTDDVVGVSTHDYDDYVYTFETEDQIYEINSFVARNCKCAIAYEAYG